MAIETVPVRGVAPGAPTGTETGAAASATDPAAANGTSSTTEPSASRRDYLARAASDPNFATSEITKFQSRADTMEANLKAESDWKGALKSYQEAGLTGDALAQHLGHYSQIMGNPELRKLIEDHQNGGNASRPGRNTSTADDDILLTDEERELRDLRSEVQRLSGEVLRQGTSASQQALVGHVESVAAELGIDAARMETVKSKLISTVESWSRQGENGRAALSALQSPQGVNTVRTLVLDALGPKGLKELYREQIAREHQTRSRYETDSPSFATAASDDPPPPVFKSAVDALRAIRGRPELGSRTRY